MRALTTLIQGIVNVFFSARFRVEGDSMLPFLRHGESVFLVRTRFRWNRLGRGDVAVFERPTASGGTVIKRVIGLPDEDVKIAVGSVHIDGDLLVEHYIQGADDSKDGEWFNGPDEYFLLGDNRGDSNDSRAFGPVPARLIKGRAWLRCWPSARWRPMPRG